MQQEKPMHPSDVLTQITQDRQQDRLAVAAAHRLVPSAPVRTRIARSLRRAADRLDAATASPTQARSALPGGGCEAAAGV
jgi:hypothetical protein